MAQSRINREPDEYIGKTLPAAAKSKDGDVAYLVVGDELKKYRFYKDKWYLLPS